MTATPQQLHALVQVIRVAEEYRRRLIQNRDALLNLAEFDVPYKTKKETLVQEGSGFIQDLLTPVLSTLGSLVL